MRILVGWDNAEEMETIQSFLDIGDNSSTGYLKPQEFEADFAAHPPDVLLLALNFPSADESFALFQRLRRKQPGVPILGAQFPGEISRGDVDTTVEGGTTP